MTHLVIAVDFQLHLQYGCSAAYAANMLQFRGTECSKNAVGLQHMLQVQCMLQFHKGGVWLAFIIITFCRNL